MQSKKKITQGFTLIELLVVVGILSVLSTVTFLVINPIEMVKESWDANRISEIQSINKALLIYQAGGGTALGDANKIYVSLPSDQADCSDLGLPSPGAGYTYTCSNSTNYRKADGTGWVPINFSSVRGIVGDLFLNLPIDPVNSVTNNSYYTYIAGSWALSSGIESIKYLDSAAVRDGGSDPIRYEVGSELALNANLSAGSGSLSTPYVWAAGGETSGSGNMFQKIDDSTGSIVGTYSAGSVSDVNGVAVDLSGNVWVANLSDDAVTKINGTTGSVLGTYSVGDDPMGVAIDESGNVWVTNNSDNTVTKINGTSGAVIGTYSTGSGPRGVIADGSGHIWVVNRMDSTVTKFDSSNGSVVGTYYDGSSYYPQRIAVDASDNIWLANAGGGVTKINGSTGGVIATYHYPSNGIGDVAADSFGNIWLTDYNGRSVVKLDASDGSEKGTYTFSNFYPNGLAIDSSGNVWASNGDSLGQPYKKLDNSGNLIGDYGSGRYNQFFGDPTGFSLQYFVAGRR